GPAAETSEAAVRRLAGVRKAHRHSRALPAALRDRDQLPADATGPHLHLHARPPPAAVLPGRGPDPTQPVGLDSSDPLGGGCRRGPDAPSGTTALQTDARLDCLRSGCTIP